MKFRHLKIPAPSLAALAALLAQPTLCFGADVITKVETFGTWALYADAKSPHQFCFVTSAPKATEPKGASRDAPRLYISAWPKDGVKAEVSFRMGFAMKAASEPVVKVGDLQFKLFSADDRIYVKDATQELKLVDAMKKGADLTAAVTSERGTAITDNYSLSGLGQALAKLQAACF